MEKGFTLVELLTVIVIVTIVSILAVVSVKYLVDNGKKGVYENYEVTLEGAAENYFTNHIEEIPNVNTSEILTLKDLLDSKDIESPLQDPNGGNCDNSYVTITRKADVGNNFDLTYKACLICTNYKTKDC